MRASRWLVLVWCCSCAGPDGSDDAAPAAARRADALASFNPGTFWASSPPATPITIPVCWMTSSFAAEKQVAIEALRATWGRVLNLDFTFKDCGPNEPPSVRVSISMAADLVGGGNAGLGKAATSLTSGDSTGWAIQPMSNGFSRDRIRYIAVHEFGHVLNFVHEEDVQGAGCPSATPWPATQIGYWDLFSVMFSSDDPSCFNRFGNSFGYLSPRDRKGARVKYGTRKIRAKGDFIGEGKASIGVWRPSNGTWYVNDNTTWPVQWGVGSDVAVPGDYNGDGRIDPAVWRPSSGTWFMNDNETWPVQWGQAGDVPVPCDYDGDGTTDQAVYRPSEKTWYINDNATWPFRWGEPGDFVVPADYTGDGKCDAAVFRPSSGRWYIAAGNGAFDFTLGRPGDIPVPGDYGGEGLVRPAVWTPSTGRWQFRVEPVAFPGPLFVGVPGDTPVAANFFGDGIDIPGIFHPAWGNTYFWYLNGGFTYWGEAGDVPTVQGTRMFPVP